MSDILMPRLSQSMTEGRLLRWCIEPGNLVREGDVVAEVETDKANMEIEALADGRISTLVARPGDVVPVGELLARVDPLEPQQLSQESSENE